MFYKRKTFNQIRNEVSEFRYLRMHAYVDNFRDMLYEIRKEPASKITQNDLQKIFSDNSVYQDYVAMLRKKFQFKRAYNSLKQDEALFLVSGITKNFEDTDKNEIRPYALQTYIFSKKQKPTLIYEPVKPTYDTIKVMVENKLGYEYVEFPQIFSKRLIKYLSKYDESSGDCNHFELEMLNMDIVSYGEIIWSEHRNGNICDLKIGDSISLLPFLKSRSKHKAIYLGAGLFISKFGKSHLGISTIQQLHDIYKTNFVARNRYFRETQDYKDMKTDTIKILDSHPDGERLKRVFANVGKGIC